MSSPLQIVPISRLFNIIASCVNTEEIEICRSISKDYTEVAYKEGIVNWEKIDEVLKIKIGEREEEILIAEKI